MADGIIIDVPKDGVYLDNRTGESGMVVAGWELLALTPEVGRKYWSSSSRSAYEDVNPAGLGDYAPHPGDRPFF